MGFSVGADDYIVKPFLPQVIPAVLMALTGIGALALERLSKDSGRKLLIAKIAASIALVVGMFDAFA